MAFPISTVRVRREFLGSSTTTHNVLMPTPIAAGDLIVVKFYNTGTSTVSASGFTEIGTQTNVARLTELAKIAAGTEGGTNINFVTSAAQFAVAHVHVVEAATWSGDIATGLAIAFSTGTAVNPDPPNLSPIWGPADTLWLPTAGKDSTGTITSAPTNYTNLLNGAGENLGSAQRELNAASEDPGTFGGANSQPYVASTLAVRPTSVPFPVVLSTTKTQFGESTTAHNVTMPATVNAGDLLLCWFISAQVSATHTTPSGWRAVNTGTASGSGDTIRGTWFAKTAVGDEDGTTVDFVTSVGTGAQAHVIRIQAGTWDGDVDNIIGNTATTGTSGAPDCGNIVHGVAQDNLFLVGHGVADNQGTDSPPTNYTTAGFDNANLTNDFVSLSAWRRLNASSDDPGAAGFTISLTAWMALGIVVPPFPTGPPTSDQEGFRWRNDDGDEASATWKAAQDTDIVMGVGITTRLRVLIDYSGDPDTATATLQYKRSDEADTEWRLV